MIGRDFWTYEALAMSTEYYATAAPALLQVPSRPVIKYAILVK